MQVVYGYNSYSRQRVSECSARTRTRARYARSLPRDSGATTLTATNSTGLMSLGASVVRARGCVQCCAAATAAPSDPVIVVDTISKSHDGEKILFSELSVALGRGQRLAVIGANGSGKSSFLNLISGADWPDEGEITQKKGIKIGFLAQDAELEADSSAIDAVVQADSPMAAAVRNYNRLLAQGEAANRVELEKALDEMNAMQAWELEEKAKEALEQVGIPDPNMSVDKMSGGQRRKVAVAAALLGAPDVLILDEPTNHMDVQFINWMADTIVSQEMTLVLVTHDRSFMEATCTQILELDSGRGYVHPIGGAGSYEKVRQRRADRRKAQASAAQDAKVVLRKEKEWIVRQPKARQSKSRARIQAFEELTQKARSGPRADVRVDFGAVQAARQGKKVLIMEGCTKKWDNRVLVGDFSYEFSPGERLGIVGPNGAGKSTFLDMIAGRTELDAGERQQGDTTAVGYFAQHPPDVNPRLRIIDYIKGIAETTSSQMTEQLIDADWGMKPDRMLEMLGFPFARQRQLVGSLSGGERRRLHLASILAKKPNFLILDEPTNDLDLTTIEVLEEMLESYNGCVLVVSHDRQFMENFTDRMFVLEGDGIVRLFDGSYGDYLEYMSDKLEAKKQREAEQERKRRTAESAAQAPDPVEAAAPVKEEKKVLRLGFREKQELERLETEVEKLGTEKEELEGRIAAVAQEGDFTKVNELTDELSKLAAKLDKKTDRWLELAEMAELAGTV